MQSGQLMLCIEGERERGAEECELKKKLQQVRTAATVKRLNWLKDTHKHRSVSLSVSRNRPLGKSVPVFQPVRSQVRSDALCGNQRCSTRRRDIHWRDLGVGHRNELKTDQFSFPPIALHSHQSSSLTFTRDVRSVPTGLSFDGQALCPVKSVCCVSGMAMVLHSRVQVKGPLFGQCGMSGMVDGWWRETINWKEAKSYTSCFYE